jgi:hypothetical protein
VAESHPQIAKALLQRAGSLKQRIIRRDEGLRRQLGVSSNPLEFTSDGVLRLAGWKPSLVQSGDPKLTQRDDPTGKKILAINAGSGTSSSSWRARVVLDPGRYQFEGRVKLMESPSIARINGAARACASPKGRCPENWPGPRNGRTTNTPSKSVIKRPRWN